MTDDTELRKLGLLGILCALFNDECLLIVVDVHVCFHTLFVESCLSEQSMPSFILVNTFSVPHPRKGMGGGGEGVLVHF